MRLWSRLIRLPLRLVAPGRVVPILTGPLRGWRWITGAATHGCWLGIYERESQTAFRELIRQGSVVFDIGANAGFFTLLASRLTGPRGAVYAFEPLPRNIDFLQRHVALNQAANVQVLPIAVSSHAGVARLDAAANPALGRLSAEGQFEVRTESLDGLIATGRLPAPQFMKIDVEGAELDVLAGAATLLQRYRPALLLSTHGTALHEQCMALLQARGYSLRLVRDGAADGQYTVIAT